MYALPVNERECKWTYAQGQLTIANYLTAAAAARSLQSCPTLCDPIDGSPPGSSVPGIFQARIVEWVAISFSNACMHAKSLQSCPTLCNPMDSRLCCICLPIIQSVIIRGAIFMRASLIPQLLKNLPVMQETSVQFLGQKDLLEKG